MLWSWNFGERRMQESRSPVFIPRSVIGIFGGLNLIQDLTCTPLQACNRKKKYITHSKPQWKIQNCLQTVLIILDQNYSLKNHLLLDSNTEKQKQSAQYFFLMELWEDLLFSGACQAAIRTIFSAWNLTPRRNCKGAEGLLSLCTYCCCELHEHMEITLWVAWRWCKYR